MGRTGEAGRGERAGKRDPKVGNMGATPPSRESVWASDVVRLFHAIMAARNIEGEGERR